MDIKFEETGEVRPPRAGEYFRNTTWGFPERAEFDFEATKLVILRLVLTDVPLGGNKG